MAYMATKGSEQLRSGIVPGGETEYPISMRELLGYALLKMDKAAVFWANCLLTGGPSFLVGSYSNLAATSAALRFFGW